MYECARICVEVDLQKGISEMIQFNMEGQSHIQVLDYEQIPLKCNTFHEYNHFTNIFPSIKESQLPLKQVSFPHNNNEKETFKPMPRRHNK